MIFATLPVFDLIIAVGYCVGTVAIGVWFARRQKDTNTYFVGGRTVGGWLILASIVATETSTVTFLSAPGLGFDPQNGNLLFLQLTFGFILGRFIVAWLLLPQYQNGQLLSAYQILRERFDSRVQRTASGLFLVTRTGADGMRLYLTALLLQQFAGWDIMMSIAVMGVATIVYTYLGGMEAVIWTDLVQFIVYISGAIAAAIVILMNIPGGWGEFVSVGMAAGKFRLWDFSFDLTRPYTFWAGLIGGAFFSTASHGADQMMVQRYLCARSPRTAKLALLASGFVVQAQFLLFLLIGIGLFVLWKQGTFLMPDTVANQNDAVFGYYIVHDLPSGLIGLLIASVLSAAMSTLSSSLNSSASAALNDFYIPIHPGCDDRHYLWVSRLSTTGFGIAQIAVAAIAAVALDQSVIDVVLSIAGFTTGLILGLFLLGRMTQPVSSLAALVGLVLGACIVFGLWLTTRLAWPWFAPLGTVSTVGCAWSLNFLCSSHSRE
ncbi:MAG: sodium/solute symporter [Bacteroidales bacterium]|nr:sodium/solute symporter [Bacteroidales bacterium]